MPTAASPAIAGAPLDKSHTTPTATYHRHCACISASIECLPTRHRKGPGAAEAFSFFV
jgi:hypothetical protein